MQSDRLSRGGGGRIWPDIRQVLMQFETFCCRLDGWARMRTLTMQISLLVSEGYSLKNSVNFHACNLAYI